MRPTTGCWQKTRLVPGVFHVLIDEHGTVLGLFNLRNLEDGSAVLGYRVARDVAGRGVATATVRELCRPAADQYRLHTLRAATNLDNVASQKVLTKAGFMPDGPADPAVVGGRPGVWYRRGGSDPSQSRTGRSRPCERSVATKEPPARIRRSGAHRSESTLGTPTRWEKTCRFHLKRIEIEKVAMRKSKWRLGGRVRPGPMESHHPEGASQWLGQPSAFH